MKLVKLAVVLLLLGMILHFSACFDSKPVRPTECCCVLGGASCYDPGASRMWGSVAVCGALDNTCCESSGGGCGGHGKSIDVTVLEEAAKRQGYKLEKDE